MGRRLFARFGFSCSVALLSVACSSPVFAGPRPDAPAAASPQSLAQQSPANDLEAASTLDLTGLQGQFSKVADVVSPSVVAISASCTPIDGDEVLQADNLNPQKLDHVLSKT